jgi:alpha-galactosidase
MMPHPKTLACLVLLAWGGPAAVSAQTAAAMPVALTPKAPATPRINGPKIFGVRPGSPFLFAIPATGDRPMEFSAQGLPAGLQLDAATGRITGTIAGAGDYDVTLRARNQLGSSERPLRIVAGDRLSLTPPLGWNSWNCWADAVDQEKVLRSARAFISSGLAQHGWTFINIDDTWQGRRGGPFNAIQPDPQKFPDIRALIDEIHGLGLKAGIYSTPWKTSYAGRIGGSADTADGAWSVPPRKRQTYADQKDSPWLEGAYPFAAADARQWAAWGFDYLKYDWFPLTPAQVGEMTDALRASGRDLIYSLSNSAPFPEAADWARLANSWRTTDDIRDTWKSMSEIGFSQDKWAPFGGPGHWNDPDMLVVGYVGWGPQLHATRLTPDEQYTHISLWSLLSAPLLLGCDLERLDDFTLGLLTNDEVLAVDQDSLGHEATSIGLLADGVVYAKPLDDGSWAVGLFNRSAQTMSVSVRWSDLGLAGGRKVRDLWRQKDLGVFPGKFAAPVPSHGVVLVKVSPAE